jgi:hypothetical protein
VGTASTACGDSIVVASCCCSVRCRLLLLRVEPPPKMRDQSVFEALVRPGHAAEQIERPRRGRAFGHHRCLRGSAIRASGRLYVGAGCYAMHRGSPEAARQGCRQGFNY